MKISAMPQSLAPGLFNRGGKHFRRGLRAMQGQCGRDVVGENAGRRREVADVAIDDAEETDQRLLVRRDRVQIAHGAEA
jgi:hypothetical protein